MKKGFTLIELLVVIAIIIIIVGLIIVSLATLRGKGRDTKRISDLNAIQGALELYKNTNGTYPETYIDLGKLTAVKSNETILFPCGDPIYDWICLGEKLQSLLSTTIRDPLNGRTYTENTRTKDYAYYYLSNDGAYKMMARLEENESEMVNDGGVYPSACISDKMYEVYSLKAKDWHLEDVTVPAGAGASNLIISEVYNNPSQAKGGLPNPNYGAYQWVEIYNPTASPINLRNWWINGVLISNVNRYIQPGAFVVISNYSLPINSSASGGSEGWNTEINQGGAFSTFDNITVFTPLNLNLNSGSVSLKEGPIVKDSINLSSSVQGFSIERSVPSCNNINGLALQGKPSPGGEYTY